MVFNYTIVWNSELWEICIILEQFGIAIKCYLTFELLKINKGTVSRRNFKFTSEPSNLNYLTNNVEEIVVFLGLKVLSSK